MVCRYPVIGVWAIGGSVRHVVHSGRVGYIHPDNWRGNLVGEQTPQVSIQPQL